jgi:hypothetical protein
MSYTNGLDKPTDYFNTKLYTGNGTTNAITGVGFQPDLVWIKKRDSSASHNWEDAVRGAGKYIRSDTTDAEVDASGTFGITSFDSDGFSLTGSGGRTNSSGGTYASWNWLASNTTASNTQGDITSTVSANTTSGFSIVSYTGTGSNATVGHGLGAEPSVIFFKNRTDVENWVTYHKPLFQNSFLKLNTTDASASNSAFMNGTSPTSSVFSLGTFNNNNGNGDSQIAYCFAEKKGFSKFGSYTGNGNADGTFVYTGFKPAFVIIKNTSNGNNWILLDNKRNTFNVQNTALAPNTSGADDTNTSNYGTDFLSNGMKMRTSGSYLSNSNNATGDTYIYMCFAENPFVTSTGIPTTAR